MNRSVNAIVLMHENGVDTASIRGAKRGIKKFLKLAGAADKIVLRYLGVYRDNRYRDSAGLLLPGKSIDWFIQESNILSAEPDDALNVAVFLNYLSAQAGELPCFAYTIALVTQDIYYRDSHDQNRDSEGVAFSGVGAVLTTSKHIDCLPRQRELIMMLNTIHELGHVFGLNRHCGRACVMKRDWCDGLAEAIHFQPFCERCRKRLRRCFPKNQKRR